VVDIISIRAHWRCVIFWRSVRGSVVNL